VRPRYGQSVTGRTCRDIQSPIVGLDATLPMGSARLPAMKLNCRFDESGTGLESLEWRRGTQPVRLVVLPVEQFALTPKETPRQPGRDRVGPFEKPHNSNTYHSHARSK